MAHLDIRAMKTSISFSIGQQLINMRNRTGLLMGKMVEKDTIVEATFALWNVRGPRFEGHISASVLLIIPL